MNNGPHNTFLTEVDEEIKHMSADEFIHQQEIQQLQLQEQKVQMKRNSKEAQTLAYNHMLERIAKMKSIWNKLDIIHRDKARTLAHFEHQVSIITLYVCHKHHHHLSINIGKHAGRIGCAVTK